VSLEQGAGNKEKEKQGAGIVVRNPKINIFL
jgi:hypothetical protein